MLTLFLSLTLAAPQQPATVKALVWSPDGATLVGSVYHGETVGPLIAWNVATKQVLWQRPEGGKLWRDSFFADGKSFAVIVKNEVLRVDASNGKTLGTIVSQTGTIQAAAFVPGTEFLATASGNNLKLWNIKTGEAVNELTGHEKEIRSVIASPDGRWLISWGDDSVRVWDREPGREIKNLFPQDRGVYTYAIGFVASNMILMGNNRGSTFVSELPSGKTLLRFQIQFGLSGITHSSAAGTLAVRANLAGEASLADLTFRVPTAEEKGKIEKLLKEFDDDAFAVREAASEAMRGIGSIAEPMLRGAMKDGASAEVRMRARESRRHILETPRHKLAGHLGPVAGMSFSPDGKLFATGAADGTVRLWDPATGRELHKWDVP